MAVSYFDWQLYGPLFADPEIADIFSEDATIAAWLRVEQALTNAQAALGMVPPDAATAIAGLTPDRIDRARLTRDVEAVGRPIVGLVRQIRDLVPEEYRRWVHLGGTTQDIMDTATMLQVGRALARIERQLLDLVQALGALSARGAGMMLAGRTNGQHAQPLRFAQKIDRLADEIGRHVERLAPIRTRVLQVQLGGAIGTLSAHGDQGPALKHAFANELGLGAMDGTWQSSRDNIGETILWLSLIAATVEKIGRTFGHLASSDLGEIRLGGSKGESSAMPHKHNPRNAEFAEALAKLARQRALAIVETGRHEHERSGGAWIAEWMLVPETFLLTAASLNKAIALAREAEPDEAHMRQNLAKSRGMLASEALVAVLLDYLGRDQARAVVAAACDRALARGNNLLDELMTDKRLAGRIKRHDLITVINAVYGQRPP